jgi:hypothetical protein
MKKANVQPKGLDANFFAAFDELAQMCEGDIALAPLKDAVKIIRTRRERGEEPTEEERQNVRGLLAVVFQLSAPLQTAQPNQ